MKPEFFQAEVLRLRSRFGSPYFDSEFLKVLWSEVRDLSDQSFRNITTHCIGEFKPEWPPKISDFREFAAQQRKREQARITAEAASNWNRREKSRDESSEGMSKAIEQLGAKSLMDAIFKKNPNEPHLKNMTVEKLNALTKKRGANE